jgi:hypothetical protein
MGIRGAGRGISTQHQASGLGADFRYFVRDFVKAVFDPYRPERHYMRGPGPKWHAKYRPAAPSYDAVSATGLVRMKAR